MPRTSSHDTGTRRAETDQTGAPRGNQTERPAAEAGVAAPAAGAEDRREALAAFLRALARRVEQDPTFARTLLAVYAESSSAQPTATPPARAAVRREGTSTRRAQIAAVPPFDPFVLLRAQGEAALRVRLGELELTGLRAILRAHRLDPARIAARWTARERIVDLIVEQVRARTSLGRAFEHV
jgi:hypothetical protein